MKTNKSLMKRIKLTRNGKVLARQSGQNHFNSKSSRSKQLNKKKFSTFQIKNKMLHRYLPNN